MSHATPSKRSSGKHVREINTASNPTFILYKKIDCARCVPTMYVLSENIKKKSFPLKFTIFTSEEKNLFILHGQVFVLGDGTCVVITPLPDHSSLCTLLSLPLYCTDFVV